MMHQRSHGFLWSMVLCAGICLGMKSATAQQQNRFELGAGIGTYIYQGDLTPQLLGSTRTMRPGVSLFGTKILSPSYGVRLHLAIGGLRGADSLYATPEYRRERNLAFRSPVWELSASFIWNIAQTNYGGNVARFAPYIGAGIGISRLRVLRDYSNFNYSYFGSETQTVAGLNADIARRTPRLIPVIPLTAGARYAINDNWDLFAETNYRLTLTDYLDGFSKVANPKLRDRYYSVEIGVIRKFGRKGAMDCPRVQ